MRKIVIDSLIKHLTFRNENLKSSKDTFVCNPRSAIYKIESLPLITRSSKDGHFKIRKLILQALMNWFSYIVQKSYQIKGNDEKKIQKV